MKKMRNENAPLKKQARMFSRGRITVPHEVRLRMGLRPGDMLEFETDGDSRVRRPLNLRVPHPCAFYNGAVFGTPPMR
jgi:AbrB family looped-hinge helix DNA binding protein